MNKQFLLVLILCWYQVQHTYGQCTVNSTDGYSVEILVTPQAIVAPPSCPFGYNYNVLISYEINFTGPAPASLYTLQGNLTCNQGNLFFNLPNGGGSGSFVTTANPYNTDTDCATATVTSLGCQAINININGPGIPNQIVNCTNAGLPIELLSFDAIATKNQEVRLTWITLTELDNDFFTLERSTNALSWDAIQQIKGAGNSKEILHYNYTDKHPLAGISYYRLKQTDFNGSVSYSKIKSVRILKPKQTLNVVYLSSTPGKIVIEGNQKLLESLQVYNSFGRSMTSIVKITPIHATKTQMDLGQLPKGLYLVKSHGAMVRVFHH